MIRYIALSATLRRSALTLKVDWVDRATLLPSPSVENGDEWSIFDLARMEL
jgi:hypothetical protein